MVNIRNYRGFKALIYRSMSGEGFTGYFSDNLTDEYRMYGPTFDDCYFNIKVMIDELRRNQRNNSRN